MRVYSILIFLLVIGLSIGIIVFTGCGDDDDNDSAGDDDGGGGDDDDDNGGGNSISAYVHDFQTKQPVQDALVQLVDNTTGEPIPGFEQTSPADGKVVFTGLSDYDLVGVKVSKSSFKNTYQYDFNVGAQDEEFLIVSDSTASIVALVLQVDLDPTKGFAAGGIYWGDPTDENPVGCAIVQTDPMPNSGIFYFGNDNLPTQDRNVVNPLAPANGTGVNPANGYWVGMNMETGKVDVTAATAWEDQDGTLVPAGTFETTTIPAVFPDSVCIANVYFSKDKYDANPSETWCTQ